MGALLDYEPSHATQGHQDPRRRDRASFGWNRLHRDRSDPDDNKKHKNKSALSVEEFMEYLTKGWKDNLDTIGAGMGVEVSIFYW